MEKPLENKPFPIKLTTLRNPCIPAHMRTRLHPEPYSVKPFGNIGIPADWRFYTPLAGRLAKAGNEEALQDLVDIIARVRRSSGIRMAAVLGAPEAPNMAGRIRNMKGIHE